MSFYERDGYSVDDRGRPIHRLIYNEFCGSVGKGKHVHHIDGNKLNNNLQNLIAINAKLHGWIHSSAKVIGRLPSRKELEVLSKLSHKEVKKILKRLEMTKNWSDKIDSMLKPRVGRRMQIERYKPEETSEEWVRRHRKPRIRNDKHGSKKSRRSNVTTIEETKIKVKIRKFDENGNEIKEVRQFER